jgi:hypothetical protein
MESSEGVFYRQTVVFTPAFLNISDRGSGQIYAGYFETVLSQKENIAYRTTSQIDCPAGWQLPGCQQWNKLLMKGISLVVEITTLY